MTDPEVTESESNLELVRRFCDTFRTGGIEEILAFFTEDGIYHNMPFEPAVGHPAIRAVLEMYLPAATDVEFEILSSATSGNLVFTERLDRMTMGERRVELPVAGVFEIVDGRIRAWRDYFDMQMFLGT